MNKISVILYTFCDKVTIYSFDLKNEVMQDPVDKVVQHQTPSEVEGSSLKIIMC